LSNQWLNNTPDEKAIWFIEVLANTDNAGKVNVFAAYKITFDGTDATKEAARRDTKITSVEFILDKPSLEKLKTTILTTPKL